MRGERPATRNERDHGPHTLKVWKGTVVGVYGNDVFVELGPRMQGVIAVREFDAKPAIGDEFEFTLRGREDALWVLARRETHSLATWEDMERGNLVHARAIRATHGGLELKIGPLHAFMPKSHTGLARDQKPDVLVGKTMTCEVIEVDRERQRVLVSRKLVTQRERDDDRQRQVGALSIGQVVFGRVTRIEPFGAFVGFGHGLEGMIHVSNLAYERVEHPSRVLTIGQPLSAKVLAVREGGKRVSLGLKQMDPSPWARLDERLAPDDVVEATVKRVMPFGAFVSVLPGVEGLVRNADADLRGRADLRGALEPGERVSVRVIAIDASGERLSLSLRHSDGTPISPDEASARASLFDLNAKTGRSLLGPTLRGALERASRAS